MSELGINRNLVNDFLGISANQATGILYVYEGENIKYLYFEGGKLIYLSFYVSKAEKIGNALLDSYKIQQDHLQAAYQQSADQGIDLKQVLMNNGVVTDAELKDVTRSLVEDEFCMMFQWHGCQTSFVEGEPDPEIFNKEYNTLKINIDVENLIKWIEKKIDENATIDQWIPSKQNVYALIGEAFDNLDQSQLSPLEMKVAEFLDGNYTVENICFQLRQHFYKIGKALVKLMSAGVAELVSGEGPTTGVRMEIQEAQAQGGVPMQQAAIAAAARTPQMEELESDGAGVPRKPHHAKNEPAPAPTPEEAPVPSPNDSARNVLTYESNTKRNVLIAVAVIIVLAAIGVGIYMGIRETADRLWTDLKPQIPGMMTAGQYDEILNRMEVIMNRADCSDTLKTVIRGEHTSVMGKANRLVELAIKKVSNLIDEKKYDEAAKELNLAKENKKKTENFSKLLELELEIEKQQKDATENVLALNKQLDDLLAGAQDKPTVEDMAAITKVLDTADTNYKGFKEWDDKKGNHLKEFTILSNDVETNFNQKYLDLLDDPKKLKEAEDAYNKVHNNRQIRRYILADWGRPVKRKIDEIKEKAASEYETIRKTMETEEHSKTLAQLKELQVSYPWFDKAEEVAGMVESLEKAIEQSKNAYDEAYKIYLMDDDTKYPEAITLFGKVVKNSKDYKNAQQKITFLNDLKKMTEGWQENDQRRTIIRGILEEYLEKNLKTIAKDDADLINRWVSKLMNYDTESKERVKNALRNLKETNDVVTFEAALKKLITTYPNSPGQREGQKQLDSLAATRKKIAEVSKQIGDLITQKRYKEARLIKDKFLREHDEWVASFLPEIPLYVKAFPSNAKISVDGKQTDTIDFTGKESVEIEVSAAGFETVKRTVKKEKGKENELVILNRSPEQEIQTKREFTAGPLVTDDGAFCPFGVGVDLYGLDGKAVWRNDALEIAVNAGAAPIHRTPAVISEIDRVFALSDGKLHILETAGGLKMKEDNVDAPETDIFYKKDPLIGLRYYLYFGTFGREIISMNAENLNVQWKASVPGIPTGITTMGDYLVVGSSDDEGTINFIDFRNGMHADPITVGNPIICPVKVKGNMIYAATRSGVIYAVDTEIKQIVWETEKQTVGPAEKIADFEIVGEKVYAIVHTDVVKVLSIPIIKGKPGEPSDEFDMFDNVFILGASSMTYDGGDILYFVTDGTQTGLGGVWAYDTVKEKILWQYMAEGTKFQAPGVDGKNVFVLTSGGKILHFKNKD